MLPSRCACLLASLPVGCIALRQQQPRIGRQAVLQSALSLVALTPQLASAKSKEERGFRSTQGFEDTYGTSANQKVGFSSRPVDLGSNGISAYQKMKLDQALGDLAEPMGSADATLKPTLEAYAKLIRAVESEQLAEVTESALSSAGAALADLSAGSSLSGAAESIGKTGQQVAAAVAKKDISTAAKAALSLGDEVTDFAYAWASADRPVAPKTAIGAPSLRAKEGATGAGAL